MILSSFSQGFAHKDCNEDGTWFRHPQTNRAWSNYTTCINFDDFEVSKWHAMLKFDKIAFVFIEIKDDIFYRTFFFYNFCQLRTSRGGK